MSTVRHWLWLSTRGSSPERYAARILAHFGTPEGAYHADQGAYEQMEGVPEKAKKGLLGKSLAGVDKIMGDCQR